MKITVCVWVPVRSGPPKDNPLQAMVADFSHFSTEWDFFLFFYSKSRSGGLWPPDLDLEKKTKKNPIQLMGASPLQSPKFGPQIWTLKKKRKKSHSVEKPIDFDWVSLEWNVFWSLVWDPWEKFETGPN